MNFKFALALGLAFSFLNCEIRAQDSRTFPSTEKVQPNRTNGRSTALPLETELTQRIRKAAKRLRESKSNNETTEATHKLTKLLGQDYEARLADYQKELDQLEEKLKLMTDKLQRKRNAKADMVKLRIEVLKAEASNLGWPSRNSSSFSNSGVENPSWPSPYRTNGVPSDRESATSSYLSNGVRQFQKSAPNNAAEVDKLIEAVLVQHSKDYQKLGGNGLFVSADAAETFKNTALKKLPPFSELSPWQIKKITSGLQHPAGYLSSETDNQVAKALAYRRQEWDKLKEAGPTTTMDKIEAVRDKTISMLPPFRELKPKQIRKIASSGLLQAGPARLVAIDVLEKYADSESLHGAFAAYQLFVFAVEYPMKGYPKDESKPMRIARQRVCFERFLKHPQRELLMEVDRELGLFFYIRQFNSPETWKEYKTEMFVLYHSFLKEQKARMTDLVDCYEVLKTIAAEDEKQDVIDIVRLKIIEHGNKCLSIFEGENTTDSKIQVQYLKNQIQQLTKLSENGTLLGTKASQLKILWSSSDKFTSWEQLRGKVTVLYFSTPSCAPCVKSVPKLIDLNKKIAEPINFVGVTSQEGSVPLKRGVIRCDDDLDKECELLQEYMAESKINWPIVLTEESVFNGSYGVRSVPHMVIVDSKGVIRDMFNPYVETEAAILNRIEAVSRD